MKDANGYLQLRNFSETKITTFEINVKVEHQSKMFHSRERKIEYYIARSNSFTFSVCIVIEFCILCILD